MGDAGAADRLTGAERRVLVAVGLPLAIGSLNLFGATLALTGIEADLQVGFDHLRWALVAFLVPDALVLVLAGRYGDFIGRRRMLLVGALVFGVGALLTSLAPSFGLLLATRAVEGLGAGLLFASLLATIADTFGPERLGRAFGVWGFVGALAFCWSPLVAGAVVHGLGWRWLFVLNGLLALVAAALMARDLPDDARGGRPGHDPFGFAVVAAGLILLLVGLLQGPTWGWASLGVLGCVLGGLVLLALGVLVELRTSTPLWPPAVLRSPGFLVGSAVVAGCYFVQELTVLIVTVYLFFVRDLTVFEAGLVLLSYSVTWLVVSQVGGRTADRIGARVPVVAGLGIGAAGAAVVAGSGSSIAVLCVGLVVLEAGNGLAVPAANAATMRHVPADGRGEASGVHMMLRQVGSALGIAAGASVLVARHLAVLGDEVSDRGGDPAALAPANLGGLLDAWRPVDTEVVRVFGGVGEVLDASSAAYESAAAATFLLATAVLAVLLVLAAVGLRGEQDPPTAG